MSSSNSNKHPDPPNPRPCDVETPLPVLSNTQIFPEGFNCQKCYYCVSKDDRGLPIEVATRERYTKALSKLVSAEEFRMVEDLIHNRRRDDEMMAIKSTQGILYGEFDARGRRLTYLRKIDEQDEQGGESRSGQRGQFSDGRGVRRRTSQHEQKQHEQRQRAERQHEKRKHEKKQQEKRKQEKRQYEQRQRVERQRAERQHEQWQHEQWQHEQRQHEERERLAGRFVMSDRPSGWGGHGW